MAKYVSEYISAKGRKVLRGDVIRAFAEVAMVSHSTAKNRLASEEKRLSGPTLKQRPARKGRKKEDVQKQELADALYVSALKRMDKESASYWIPTELALKLAARNGAIPAGTYTRSTMDRLLRQHGLSINQARISQGAKALWAEHPNQVWMCDASPLNHYYLRLDNKVIFQDFPRGDTHKADTLAKKKLYKIWVYYVIDVFSGIWFAKAYNPIPRSGRGVGGENSEDWIDFLKFAFSPKKGLDALLDGYGNPLETCPMQGIPEILYSDAGSGLTSTITSNFLERLGCKFLAHEAGKPSSKGRIEGRIGASKRSFEGALLTHTISKIEQVTYFYQRWANYSNLTAKKGNKYTHYISGTKDKPLRVPTVQNFRDAMTSFDTRTIQGHGEVEIDGEPYFVSENHLGTRVSLHRAPAFNGEEQIYFAELPSGLIIKCKPGLSYSKFTEPTRFKKSAKMENNEEAIRLSAEIRQYMTFEDTLPEDVKGENVTMMPNIMDPVKTHSVVPPVSFANSDDAIAWIQTQTKGRAIITDSDLLNLREILDEILVRLQGKPIPGSYALKAANIYIESEAI